MEFGGFQKISLIDYPKHLCAIVWTVGCNFRCPFCYNRDLVFGKVDLISEGEILGYLNKRKGILEALTITGGEPTIHPDLREFIKKVKRLDYLVKLDSNGTNPQVLESLLQEKLVDYVAMDIKAPPEKYHLLAGVEVNQDKIKKSVEIIRQYAPDYEFRTTVVPNFLNKDDFVAIAKWLKGSKKYFLQQFEIPVHLINQKLESFKPYQKEVLEEILETIRPYFKESAIRGA